MKITPVQSSSSHLLSPIVDWYLSASPGDAIDVTELPVEYVAMTPETFRVELVEAANSQTPPSDDHYSNLAIEIETLGCGRTSSGFRITRK